MNRVVSRFIAASLAACTLAAAAPAATVTAGAVTSASQSASKVTTMYVTKTAYTYTKKNGKMVRSTKLKKGDAVKVKSSSGNYYVLTSGKYILKTSVGSKRVNWTDTKLSKASTRYVLENGAKILDKALPSGKTVKTLSAGAKITIVAKTNSGYYKLKDGGYIKQSLVGTKKPSGLTVSAPSAAAKKAGAGITVGENEGKEFNIYCWNEEFKNYFEKYYTVPEGIFVNWHIYPSYDGEYQDRLDRALANQAKAADDDKVDMFLAEPDFMLKYVESDFTMDVGNIGITPYTTEYKYTYQAATDSNGKLKGVSFQLCPGALIYRRSIAEDVLGTSDPDEVQKKLDSWEKFNDVAAAAKEKGYYMTASYAETFRTFSQNTSTAWVDSKNRLVIDSNLEKWVEQAEDFIQNGYTLPVGLWSDEKFSQTYGDGKTMCFFGPSWYYNFCMWGAMDPDNGCYGDWAICQGPEPDFWGGTWLLAAEGSDNPEMLADIFNAFTANDDICSALVENEMQFVNNSKVIKKYAGNADYGSSFLGGQNDLKVLDAVAKKITNRKTTMYDTLLTENFSCFMLDYFNGIMDKETALECFYNFVNEKYPAIVTP